MEDKDLIRQLRGELAQAKNDLEANKFKLETMLARYNALVESVRNRIDEVEEWLEDLKGEVEQDK